MNFIQMRKMTKDIKIEPISLEFAIERAIQYIEVALTDLDRAQRRVMMYKNGTKSNLHPAETEAASALIGMEHAISILSNSDSKRLRGWRSQNVIAEPDQERSDTISKK